jgi:hypothetical protein
MKLSFEKEVVFGSILGTGSLTWLIVLCLHNNIGFIGPSSPGIRNEIVFGDNYNRTGCAVLEDAQAELSITPSEFYMKSGYAVESLNEKVHSSNACEKFRGGAGSKNHSFIEDVDFENLKKDGTITAAWVNAMAMLTNSAEHSISYGFRAKPQHRENITGQLINNVVAVSAVVPGPLKDGKLALIEATPIGLLQMDYYGHPGFECICEKNQNIAWAIAGDNGGGCFYVKDNGVGLNMGYKKKVFGVFSQLEWMKQFGAFGIGTALVSVICIQGEKIWSKSRLNEASTNHFH